MRKPKSHFTPGKTLVTQGALQALTNQDILTGISRHIRGDWGELDEIDRLANERALVDGRALMSVFRSEKDLEFYVVTEADRSITMVMLPTECRYVLTDAAGRALCGTAQAHIRHELPARAI